MQDTLHNRQSLFHLHHDRWQTISNRSLWLPMAMTMSMIGQLKHNMI